MGPFELADLVGVDVGFEVSKSFYAQSFGEPRWRPSLLAARKVASGAHGRKTGRGWYEYPEDGEHRPPDPDPAGARRRRRPRGDRRLEPRWPTSCARPRSRPACARSRPTPRSRARGRLRRRRGGRPAAPRRSAGDPLRRGAARGARPRRPGRRLLRRRPAGRPWSSSRPRRRARTPPHRAAERFFTSLGRHVEWVGDAPGLVLGRIVCQLVNEACFALGDNVGAPEDIDAGMVLGLNHPRGPLEWGDAIGPSSVLGVIAGALRRVPRGALPRRARAAARRPHRHTAPIVRLRVLTVDRCDWRC